MKIKKMISLLFMLIFSFSVLSNNGNASFNNVNLVKNRTTTFDLANVVNYDMESKTISYEDFDVGDYSLRTTSMSTSSISDSINDNLSPAIIIGDDDMTIVDNTYDWPYRATVYIEVYFNGNPYRGTGFLEGPDLLVTAAHCIYADKSGNGKPSFVDSIEVYAGAKSSTDINLGENYKYFAKAKTLNIQKEYYQTEDSNYDWCAIQLDRKLGDIVGYYGKISDYYQKNSGIFSFSYPAHVKTKNMYYSRGKLLSSTDYQYSYDMDTFGGSSGAPIFVVVNSNTYVCGIHTSGSSQNDCNYGVIFNDFIFEYLNSFVVEKHMRYLELTLLGKSGSNWNIKVENKSTEKVIVDYNSKMCFENDAKKWTNLNDVKSIDVNSNDYTTIKISTNWFATHIAVSYYCSYGRMITYAHDLKADYKSMIVGYTKV